MQNEIEDDRTKSWTPAGKWSKKETRKAAQISNEEYYGQWCDTQEAQREKRLLEIETQLEKINGKIDAINAAIEELTRRVFAGKA